MILHFSNHSHLFVNALAELHCPKTFFACVIPGVDGSSVCPVSIDTIDDSVGGNVPRLQYLRLDGNEIKPPIPREVILCFRLLRSIVI